MDGQPAAEGRRPHPVFDVLDPGHDQRRPWLTDGESLYRRLSSPGHRFEGHPLMRRRGLGPDSARTRPDSRHGSPSAPYFATADLTLARVPEEVAYVSVAYPGLRPGFLRAPTGLPVRFPSDLVGVKPSGGPTQHAA